ncbi:MAG TPA: FAD-dependent oxidoreductase [Paludibacter sp.]|nr:FAD-dependent oxidoreductase [Paludibacter sp.]
MERDGARISLWQADMPGYVPVSRDFPLELFDVAIIGGGITGLATAVQLQKNGKKCVVVEKSTIGFGSTGGTTAHFNTFFDTTYDQVQKDFGKENAWLLHEAAIEALNTLESNIRDYNIACDFEYKDAYLFAKDKKQAEELDRIVKASQEAGLRIAYSGDILIDRPFEKAALIEQQAQFHPVRYVYALANAFEKGGGVILQGCMMESFDDDELPITVKTSSGVIHSRQLVFATHIPPGLNILHFRCAPYRSYVLAVKLKNDAYPGGLVYDMDVPYHYYRTQRIGGQQYLVFGGEDHKTGHDEDAYSHFGNLETYLGTHFDLEEVSYRWSSQFYEPGDGLAYIGRFPGHSENVFVATGFGGDGMPYSHMAAKLLGDLILHGQSRYEKLFDPGRIKPIAGFSSFVSENADVIKEFIAKRISIEKVENLDELAPGEARIIRYKGEQIAVYRNDSGILMAIDPVCTHARCIVQWNNAEKTWDCPCHGARYTVEGEILTGPATRKLGEIEMDVPAE